MESYSDWVAIFGSLLVLPPEFCQLFLEARSEKSLLWEMVPIVTHVRFGGPLSLLVISSKKNKSKPTSFSDWARCFMEAELLGT